MNEATRIEPALIAHLSAREKELTRRLERVKANRRRAKEPLAANLREQAIQRENDPVLDEIDDVERRELLRTRAALKRIDAGCFGICDDCGADIDPYRLEVDPAAANCIECAERREARPRRGGAPPRLG